MGNTYFPLDLFHYIVAGSNPPCTYEASVFLIPCACYSFFFTLQLLSNCFNCLHIFHPIHTRQNRTKETVCKFLALCKRIAFFIVSHTHTQHLQPKFRQTTYYKNYSDQQKELQRSGRNMKEIPIKFKSQMFNKYCSDYMHFVRIGSKLEIAQEIA